MSNPTVQNDLPTLNTDLLTTMVKWAGQDVADLTDFFKQAGFPDWEQESWASEVRNGSCETACCIAGNVAVQSGYGLVYDDMWHTLGDIEYPTPERWAEMTTEEKQAMDGDYAPGVTIQWYAEYAAPKVQIGVSDKGTPMYRLDMSKKRLISELAREALGLDEREASYLFHGSNRLGDVVLVATAIAQRRGVTLDLPTALAEKATEPHKNDWATANPDKDPVTEMVAFLAGGDRFFW